MHAQTIDPQLLAMREAINAAERGQLSADVAASLSRHPLAGWLEYADFKRNIDTLSNTQAQDFLKRYTGQPVADALRNAWLPVLARRQDWSTFLANWKPTDNVHLRCSELTARQAIGRVDPQWTREAQTLWRNAGKPLPDTCDAVFTGLAERGELSPALRWERIQAAADAQQPAVMRFAARGLPLPEQALAADYALFVEQPHARALSWPKTERSRRIAADGLEKLAKSNPDQAERQLPQYANALGFSDAQRAQVLYQIALWTVASYLPDAARRLNAVPETAYDERLHEWRAREAMSRSDWPAALVAIRKMPPTQRGDARWQYFEARMAEKTGARAEAQALYHAVAHSPTFHGFLAADRLQRPYRLCPWEPEQDAQAKDAIARDPALQRAIALFQIDRPGWAELEWNAVVSRLDDTQRRLAVVVASDNGWFDRAVIGLGKQAEELRWYTLRFPLHYADIIRRETAKNALDPTWIAAEIRAESIFNPRARSPANALGLMQILPETGAMIAKRVALPGYRDAGSLYDPDTNIAIGTAYLRQLLDTYGFPYITIAAYNAGPNPVARWQSQRPGLEPDLWVETINYKETREYVARVLAFSVIYDWRLNGDALPLSDRLIGKGTDRRKPFVCKTGSGAGATQE